MLVIYYIITTKNKLISQPTSRALTYYIWIIKPPVNKTTFSCTKVVLLTDVYCTLLIVTNLFTISLIISMQRS